MDPSEQMKVKQEFYSVSRDKQMRSTPTRINQTTFNKLEQDRKREYDIIVKKKTKYRNMLIPNKMQPTKLPKESVLISNKTLKNN